MNRREIGLFGFLVALTLACAVVQGCDGSDNSSSAPTTKTTKTAAWDCPEGATRTGQTYAVTGEDIVIRSGPGVQYDKVVNPKATENMHKTQYATIDFSTTVRELCRLGGWSKIQLMEPEWLVDSHKGWVPTSALRTMQVDHSGVRIFTEADFSWDNQTRPFKNLIIAGVNRLHHENKYCTDIDPVTLMVSDKSKRSNLIFFVTCGKSPNFFNYFFSKHDLETGKSFAAPPHIDHVLASQLCESYAKRIATHPSTVEFSIWHMIISDQPDGHTVVLSTFTARNSFNLKTTFNIQCLFNAGGFIKANVAESAD